MKNATISAVLALTLIVLAASAAMAEGPENTMRIEAMVGAALAGGHLDDQNRHGNYEFAGGTSPGLSAGVQLWWDDYFTDPSMENVSLGVEYDFNWLGAKWKDTSNRDVDADIYLHSFMGNVAYRWEPTGKLTPYIGAGAGFVWCDVSAKDTGTDIGTGESGIAPMLQGFIGADYDLGDNYYMGIEMKYGGFTTFGVNTDIGYAKVDTLFKIGYTF